MSVVLRTMRENDLPAVLDLERRLFPGDAWTEQMFREELAGQPASRDYLVAEETGALVGYAGLAVVGYQADIQTLAVRRESWGRGIGGRLLAALLTEAGRRGCREVFLEVRSDNARAQELYRRFGFTVIGRRRGYYRGADALVMRRALDGVAGGADTASGEATPDPTGGDTHGR